MQPTNWFWSVIYIYPRWHNRQHGYCVKTRLSACLSVCVCVCVCIYLFVLALRGKRLELSTPDSVYIYSVAVARHALTRKSKGQGHTVTKTVMAHGC